MTNSVLRNIVAFVGIVFLLLGVLFGAQIFTFIFGNISQANIASLDQDSNTVVNGSGFFINSTILPIPEAAFVNFSGGLVVQEAFNVTIPATPELIPASDYIVGSLSGTITNATNTVYPNVNLSYTFNTKTQAQLAIETANNNSLQSLVTYTNQSSTQLNTAAIAITLLVLIALFVVFWNSFIGPMMTNASNSTKGGSFAT